MNILFITGFISSDLIRAFCWTLLHSFWQGLLAAALAGLIVLSTRHSRAAVRYNLLSIVFIGFIICSLFTFLSQPGLLIRSSAEITKSAVTAPPAAGAVIMESGSHRIPAFQKKTFFQPILYYGNRYSALITGVWAVFFLINFLKMFSGLRYAYRLRYLHTVAPATEWEERLNVLRVLLGLRHRVPLKESGIIPVPVVVGFLRPVILVPLGMFSHLSPEQVETILLHELGHIRRKDFAVNLLQRLTESVFFFNPFIGWISSLIREEREACCDDIVLEYTTDKKSYLEALVSFREREPARTPYAIGLGSSHSLLNRVKRIVNNENKKLNMMEKITLGIVLVAGTAFGFIPGIKARPENAFSVNQKTGQVVKAGAFLLPGKKEISGISALLPLVKDTVPDRSVTFKIVNSKNNDDKKEKISEANAMGSDGKKYSYKTVNDEIVDFSIDGSSVGRENFKDYEFVVKKIEDQIKQEVKRMLDKQENALDLLQTQQQLPDKKKWQLQQEYALLLDSLRNQLTEEKESGEALLKNKDLEPVTKDLQLLEKKLDLENERQADRSLKLLKSEQMAIQQKGLLLHENKLNLENKMALNQKLAALQQEQLGLEGLQKLKLDYWKQTDYPDEQLARLIDDLEDKGLIGDRKNFSVTLNQDELIVNGKKAGAALHAELKERYIKSKKYHYIYKTNGHSTSTDIYRDDATIRLSLSR